MSDLYVEKVYLKHHEFLYDNTFNYPASACIEGACWVRMLEYMKSKERHTVVFIHHACGHTAALKEYHAINYRSVDNDVMVCIPEDYLSGYGRQKQRGYHEFHKQIYEMQNYNTDAAWAALYILMCQCRESSIGAMLSKWFPDSCSNKQ